MPIEGIIRFAIEVKSTTSVSQFVNTFYTVKSAVRESYTSYLLVKYNLTFELRRQALNIAFSTYMPCDLAFVTNILERC